MSGEPRTHHKLVTRRSAESTRGAGAEERRELTLGVQYSCGFYSPSSHEGKVRREVESPFPPDSGDDGIRLR